MIVAVCGKGGVGKTTIAAIAARELLEAGDLKALLVDADPAGGLSMALDIHPVKTLNDIRLEIIEEMKKGTRDERDLALSADYLLAGALCETGSIALLSLGRPEDAGCYCKVNALLKEAIECLASGFDVTVIDAEAGIEQVNRRVFSSVDSLLLVSDTSLKGLEVAGTIYEVAKRFTSMKRVGLVINRVSGEEARRVRAPAHLELLGMIPEDNTIKKYDEDGKSFLVFPTCPSREAIGGVLREIGVLKKA